MIKVVITIPAYNEQATISRIIKNIKQVMGSEDYNCEVLVIDDGSKDNTAEIAGVAGALVHSHPYNYGLAETFRTEIEKSLELKADIIVHIDADGQYLAKDIPRLIAEIQKGYDIVLGSRFKGKIEQMPLIKRLGNIAFSWVVSNIAKTRITDAQTGFRAFTAKCAKEVPITSNHTYTQEQIIRAVRKKFKIKEIPVFFAKRIHGKSRLMKGPIRYALKAWINILRVYRDYEPLKFFGSTGLFLLIVAIIAGLFPIYLFFTGRFETLDRIVPTIMLIILVFLTGLQIILFGFLADKKNI